MEKTAWVFPGQGSQVVGMADSLLADPEAATLFERASELLGWSVEAVCAGERDLLERTLYTQPALFTVGVGLVQRLRSSGIEAPDFVAGHSLGEYTALWAAGAFDFETGLKLVAERGRLMDAQMAGAMAALIGFDREKLDALCAETPGVVVANDNSAMQVVISGTPERVAQVSEAIRAKRVVPLNVSGAFHSPLMAPAAAEFARVLDSVTLQTPRMPVLQNVDPEPVIDPDVLKANLARQVDHPVRWRETILKLVELGVTELIEIGPGATLTGLAKKTGPGLKLRNIKPDDVWPVA